MNRLHLFVCGFILAIIKLNQEKPGSDQVRFPSDLRSSSHAHTVTSLGTGSACEAERRSAGRLLK